MEELREDIREIQRELKEVQKELKQMSERIIRLEEAIKPLTKLMYGGITLILTSVIVAVLALIFK